MVFVGSKSVMRNVCCRESGNNFTYLGYKYSYKYEMGCENKNNKSVLVCGVIYKNFKYRIRKHTNIIINKTVVYKLFIYNIIYIQIFYCFTIARSWVLNKKQERHMQAVEMRPYRTQKEFTKSARM